MNSIESNCMTLESLGHETDGQRRSGREVRLVQREAQSPANRGPAADGYNLPVPHSAIECHQ